MAVYNGARYLREAVESVLNQSFQDFEFLVINDGSTDHTREIILSYDDSRIRLVDNRQNRGQTASLNLGLQLAQGDLIARQDADDISEPERLARQVLFLEDHSEVALLGTGYAKIDSHGNVTGIRKLPLNSTDIRWSLLFFCPFVHSAVVFRKSLILQQIGFYNEAFTYSQDYELWLRIARQLEIANLPEPLVRFRISSFSMTASYGDKTQEGHRLRIANMAHLLNWNEATQTESAEKQFRAMVALLFGSRADIDPWDSSRTVQEVLRLHKTFCAFYRLSEKECAAHRERLRARLSRRLLEVAYYSVKDDYGAARQLVVQACRLHWPILLTRSLASMSLKLLAKMPSRQLH
jgi:glycosyl transferase family 2